MISVPFAPRFWLAAGLTLLLAGCVLPPKEEPGFTELDANSLGLSDNQLPVAAANWWTALGDPQLNRLIEESLASNPSLAEALARMKGARAQVVAAGAAIGPSVTLDGEEVRQRLSENYIYPPAGSGFDVAGGDITWMGQLGLNLSWDLDFWGRQSGLLDQAKAQVHAAELDQVSAELALSGSIVQSYVDLYRAYAMADIAQENEQQRQTLLRLTKNRVAAGLETSIAVKTAEAALPQARRARLQAESERDIAVHNLAALSGHGVDVYNSITRPQLMLDAALPLPSDLSLDILSRRPDILAARTRVEAASRGRDAARAAFYPDISLTAFAGYQAVGLDKLFDSGSLIYGAGPAVHLPIFQANRLKASYFGAGAERDAAVASYNDTVLNAIRDVADLLSRKTSLSRQIEQVQQELAASEAAYSLAQNRYQAGLSSQLVVLNAESNVLNARRDLVSLNSQLLNTRVALLLTVGGSFDPTTSPAASQAELSHE